jgi:hypothetical protein
MEELDQERRLAPLLPVVIGDVLIVLGVLLRQPAPGAAGPGWTLAASARGRVERLAMEARLRAERALGYRPRDMRAAKCGRDIEAARGHGRLGLIDVNGWVVRARTVKVTQNEIFMALSEPDDFVLALVLVDGRHAQAPRYLRRPFRAPRFAATSVNYDLRELLAPATEPM